MKEFKGEFFRFMRVVQIIGISVVFFASSFSFGEEYLYRSIDPIDGRYQSATVRFEKKGTPHIFIETQGPVVFPAKSRLTDRFVFLSDTQGNPEALSSVLPMIKEFQPEAILHGGDLVNESDDLNEWKSFFSVYGSLLQFTPLLAAFGDHEFKPSVGYIEDRLWNVREFQGDLPVNDAALPAALFSPRATKEKRYYGAVRIGSIQIFVLDSNVAPHADGNTHADPETVPYLVEQTRWLSDELEHSRHDPSIRYRIALFHWPPFGSNPLVTSLIPFTFQDAFRETIATRSFDHTMRFLFNRVNHVSPAQASIQLTPDDYVFRDWVPLFQKYDVKLILTGHLHRYEHLALDNMHVVTAGAAGGFINSIPQKWARALTPIDFSTLRNQLENLRPDLSREEIDRYTRIHVETPPTLVRTVTFIEADSSSMQVYTIGIHGNRTFPLDRFEIDTHTKPLTARVDSPAEFMQMRLQ